MTFVSVLTQDEWRKQAGFRTLDDAKMFFIETYHYNEFKTWLKKEAERKLQQSTWRMTNELSKV